MPKIFKALDVQEPKQQGGKPFFTEVATIMVKDDGKVSLYLPLTGRWYPCKLKEPYQGGGGYQNRQSDRDSAAAPGPGYQDRGDQWYNDNPPPPRDDDVPF